MKSAIVHRERGWQDEFGVLVWACRWLACRLRPADPARRERLARARLRIEELKRLEG